MIKHLINGQIQIENLFLTSSCKLGNKEGIVYVAGVLPKFPSQSIVEAEGDEAEESDEDQREPKPELKTFVYTISTIDGGTTVISTTMADLPFYSQNIEKLFIKTIN